MLALPSLRLKGHYLAMATLGFGELMSLAFAEATPITGGVDGFSGIPFPPIGPLQIRTPPGLYWLVWAVAGVALLARGEHGLAAARAARCARCTAASSGRSACGVDVVGVKVRAFVDLGGAGGAGGRTLRVGRRLRLAERLHAARHPSPSSRWRSSAAPARSRDPWSRRRC